MAIPAGHIITVGGLNVIDRLQDTGLQNPKVPTETIRETGNDLVVGKILTEANFQFQMQSWDVSCDMMAMLEGKVGGAGAEEGPSHGDAEGTAYHWENCQFIHLACPWARDTGTEGGDIASGVVVPMFYPTALAYKFGVTANAEQTVTLEGGSYYMAEAYPIEQKALTTKEEAPGFEVTTAEKVRVHRVGGAGGEEARWVLGVLVNGVIQERGVDYSESGGITLAAADAAETPKALEEAAAVVKVKFLRSLPNAAVIKIIYFSEKPHAIAQTAHATTSATPAAVRGRNIEVLLGKKKARVLLRGAQSFDLNASHSGSVQREMGQYDPIGYAETGIDCNGSVTIEPKEEAALYEALAEVTGVSRNEVYGYLNEHTIPLTVAIFNPAKPSELIKTISVADALFQIPGTSAKANTTVGLPLSFESQSGTFSEIKKGYPEGER